MTSRRVTLTRCFQHIDGFEVTAELDVLVMHDPPTRLEPGGDDVEPLALRIEGRDACVYTHADIVSDILENEDIPAAEDIDA